MKYLALIPSLVISMFISSKVMANDIIFQCITENKKHILVTRNKDTVSYKFGKIASNPELALTTSKVNYMPWNGVGSYVVNRLEIQNENVTYTIFSSYRRDPDNLAVKSGVTVSKNDRDLATIYCNDSSKIINNLDDEKLLLKFKN